MKDLRLKNDSTIAIIGGGPGGVSCAIKLKKESEKIDLNLRIVIFEGKDFDYLYNQCVGVLSPPFMSILKDGLNITLPPELIKRKISGYRLYGTKHNILLKNNQIENADPTYVVRRIKFDNFMLNYAKSLGIEVVKSRTTYVEFVKDKFVDEVRIFGERGYLTADIVVGAFGLDEAMLGVFEKTTCSKNFSGYRRPKKYLRSYITKIFIDNKFIEKKLGNTIFAFIPGEIPNIEFAAITPKDGYIMINIAGKNVNSTDMDIFLNISKSRGLLPKNYGKLDFFEGLFPISPSNNAYGDRYITVGDTTGWMRPFKGKGINTALVTGMRAAYTIIHYGISHKAFKRYELQCKDLTDDYFFGMLVRNFTKISSRIKSFDHLIKIAKKNKTLYNALYNSVSGQMSYKKIIQDIIKKGAIIQVLSPFFPKRLYPF